MNRIYRLLLRLYPVKFRREFEEQMFLDFSDLEADARKKGSLSFVVFCLRELVDYPFNLLKAYMKDGRMATALRSQPVNYGLRGAVGFSVATFLAFMISSFISWKFDSSGNSLIGYLQVYFYDVFHTEHGLELIAWLSPAFSSLLTGLVFGLLLAILFADWQRYLHYILIGMLGWFLHSQVTNILWYAVNLNFFLGSRHYFYLYIALGSLSGAFLGLIFAVAKSDKKELIRLMAVGAIAYPLLAYFYVKLLFKLSIIETPWMFIALMCMVIMYLASVFLMAVESQAKPRMPWMVIVGAIGYPLMPYMGRFIPQQLLPSVNMPTTLYLTDPAYWQYMFLIAIQEAIYAIPFGLLVGIALGFQRKNDPFVTAPES